MSPSEQDETIAVLQSIPASEWNEALVDAEKADAVLRHAHEALGAAGLLGPGKTAKPVAELVSMLGDRTLSHPKMGELIRRLVLRNLAPTKWDKLAAVYKATAGRSATPLHGNMKQAGVGSDVMAERWKQGGAWARAFCHAAGLPMTLALSSRAAAVEDEELQSHRALPPLHDFQSEVYKKLRRLLANGSGRARVLSLPTGAGKTRVVVESAIDHISESRTKANVILWLATSDELLRQAWACFRQVWHVPPEREGAKSIVRPGLLRLVRIWGGRKVSKFELDSEATVLIASTQQLGSWLKGGHDLAELIPSKRLAAVVVDEVHHIVAPQHRKVMVALGLRKKLVWEPVKGAPPVIGLTATPWRSQERESNLLWKFFSAKKGLITPRTLKERPIGVLQKRKVLSRIDAKALNLKADVHLTAKQRKSFETFKSLPEDVISGLGRDSDRNGAILKRLLKLPKKKSTIVFACSVEHAHVLTVALNRAGRSAACVTGETPRRERLEVLQAFQAGTIRFLCNVSVLTTGFDAPRVDVVCITRPTHSSLLYEQMVGRGLRGPKNGGTTRCLVLDVQDKGLPGEIMSYARVLKEWDEERKSPS